MIPGPMRPAVRGSLAVLLLAAALLSPSVARAQLIPTTGPGSSGPESRTAEEEKKKDAAERAKKKKPEEWRAASAKLTNPWMINVSVWTKSYVALGTNVENRIGPFVTGVSPSIRMGGSWRFDLGVAFNRGVVAMYPAFRNLWINGAIFSMWVTTGFILPLEQETLNTCANCGVFFGPGFRWWLADGFGIYFEAIPNYRFDLGLVIEAALGVEIGVF